MSHTDLRASLEQGIEAKRSMSFFDIVGSLSDSFAPVFGREAASIEAATSSKISSAGRN